MRILDTETWRELGQSLSRHRTRTILTGAGVFWGMFILVVMVAFGRGLQRGVLGSLSEYSSQTVWAWPERTTMPFAGELPGRPLTIRLDDLDAVVRQVPGVVAISPRNSVGADDEAPVPVRRGARHGGFGVTGEGPAVGRMRMMAVDQGRFINEADIRERRKIAFIGSRVFAQLYDANESAVGTRIVIREVEFVVGGVFRMARTGTASAQQENAIILPWTTLAQVYGPRDRVSSFAVLTADGVDTLGVENALKELLRRRHRVHPDDTTAFDTWNAYREAREYEALFLAIDVLLWTVGGLTLVAGALGVGNVMLVAVRERTPEIGLRRALGATTAQIVGSIVLESITLTFLAGYLGLVAAIGALYLVAESIAKLPVADRPETLEAPIVDLTVALGGFATLVVAGVVASYLPSRNAARIHPAAALQSE